MGVILVFIKAMYVLVCILLTVVILLQSSKGGGLAGTFGGSTMGAAFGGRGTATFLSRTTTVLATLFLVVALVIGLMTRGSVSEESLVGKERERIMQSQARSLPQVPESQVVIPPTGTSEQPANTETKTPKGEKK